MKTILDENQDFIRRHIGPDDVQIGKMLQKLDISSLDELVELAVPQQIRLRDPLGLDRGKAESALLEELSTLAQNNQMYRSYIGLGYAACFTPTVIQRNILENPGWYTQYTPYQAEIAQGRLEALLNFQTLVMDLSGMELANASLLDEATAAAEAMAMMHALQAKNGSDTFFVAQDCHPPTIAVVQTRAEARGWEVVVGDHRTFDFSKPLFGVLLQYPATDGAICDLAPFCDQAHQANALIAVATDLLSLTLLPPPGEWGADVVIGNSQRLGMPMGFGGPHAAFFATREEYRRQVPGRIIGVSEDASGKPALRMALQTREQHIKRERATSNICTAQVLPAVVVSMYAVYHGPQGLRRIAEHIHYLARLLATGALQLGYEVVHSQFFDTVCLRTDDAQEVVSRAQEAQINLRLVDGQTVGITLDETVRLKDIDGLFNILAAGRASSLSANQLELEMVDSEMVYRSEGSYLTHPVFNSYHSETEMLRYMRRLEAKDLSLTSSMIPLGSCTMKLNATTEMMPITWPQFAALHPFAPMEQAAGYAVIFAELEHMLAKITGLVGVSLQPNAGSQGEFAGLLAIRAYHLAQGQEQRNICLIPASAHGTNPASAVMAGMQVVVVACDEQGNIELADLRDKAQQHGDELAALMVTYPSTHGVFEEEICQICDIIHAHGGQVYMDGANMNALVGLCRPGDIGVDVCHLNLHKTFCIPHGGGGPGMGPIAVAAHLVEFLPSHPIVEVGGAKTMGTIAAAPWGSALILLISWAYIKMMGEAGLTHATKVAILNANYVARRLDSYFPVLYKGKKDLVAHEAIIDLRHCKSDAGITVEDVAKRLMDYGFHAPTVSFPVAGTLMVEPTESEVKTELDRFCEAMISIHAEIEEIAQGKADREDNLLQNAPHTAEVALAEEWSHPYSRQRAVLPAHWLKEYKFWPAVGRLNNALGDRNLVCACLPIEAYE